MQAAVLSTEDGMRAQADLKSLFENKQKELDDRQRVLATEQQALQKLNPNSDQAKKRAGEWQAKANALQAAFQASQNELKEREAALTAPILQKMQRVLRDVAAKRRLKFVIDKQAVPLAPPENDLTAEVSRAYDAAEPAKK
jgi:outer membrane protein